MHKSKEGKAAINLWYVFGHPTEDRRSISAPTEVEDSITNANGDNVSGSGPNDEHDVSQEGSLDLMQKVAWTILVRFSWPDFVHRELTIGYTGGACCYNRKHRWPRCAFRCACLKIKRADT